MTRKFTMEGLLPAEGAVPEDELSRSLLPVVERVGAALEELGVGYDIAALGCLRMICEIANVTCGEPEIAAMLHEVADRLAALRPDVAPGDERTKGRG